VNTTEDRPSPAVDDPRVIRAVEEYLAALEAGGRPDRAQFLARHAEVAAALAECLDGLEFVRAAAPQLRPGDEAPTQAPAGELLPAALLGDFRIVREVGRGGMGVVYEAEQVSLGRLVALKVLPLAAALDGRQLQRFKNEAQAAAQLHHSNIVPVYAVGCERGVHYYAMQFIDGQSLAALIRDLRRQAGLDGARRGARGGEADSQPTTGFAGPAEETPAAAAAPPTDRPDRGPAFFRSAARLGAQAAEALEYAHQMGVVHRDVKPANLLLDARGNLWVTDFGLARLGGDAGLTLTGDLVGTVRYMSPEQALGRRVPADHRMDVYSLGATLYELLTLEPAVRGGERAELLRQVAFEEPLRPRRLNRAVPAELETVVLKALEKSPAERYATAQELADDLQRYLRDEPIRARRPTLAQRARKWARRHRPAVVSAAAAAAVLLLLTVAGLAVSNARISHEKQNTLEALGETRRAYEEKDRAWQGERQALYAYRINRAHREWLAGHVGLAEQVLAECPPDLRGWEWDYLNHLGRPEPLLRGGGAGLAVAFSPDGALLASGWGDGRVQVWDARAGRGSHAFAAYVGAVTGLAFSPDGGRLVTAGQDEPVKVWDTRTGRLAFALPAGREGQTTAVAVSPDGRHLATGGTDGCVRLADAATGREFLTLRGHKGGITGVAFSPAGGGLLASCATDRTVRVWDTVAGRPLRTLSGHTEGATAVAYSPDGRRLLSASHDRTVRLWDAASGAALRTDRVPGGGVSGLALSPDGRRYATAGSDQTVRLWDAASGAELRTYRGHAAWVRRVAYSPDGRRLASAGDDWAVLLWDTTADQEATTFRRGREAILGVGFTGEGRCLALALEGFRTVRVCDVATGREVFRRDRAHGDHRTLLSADGRRVAWWGRDDTPEVWDVQSGQPVPAAFRPHGAPGGLLLGPDGRFLVGRAGLGPLHVWDLAAGQEAPSPAGSGGASHATFSPDGRLLGWAEPDGAVRVWGLLSAREVRAFPGPAPEVTCLAFSADGGRLAWATFEGVIRVADLATGQGLLTMRGPPGQFWGVAFSPDGRRLASANADRTVKLWDLARGQEVLTLAGHSSAVILVAFSPDGRTLVSAEKDGALKLWSAAPSARRAGPGP
jgi:WD40 repeat protein/serine/threonine protein kinase